MNSEYYKVLRNNLPAMSEKLAHELDYCVKKLNDHVYDGLLKEFVEKQSFTQPSASLANKRHVFWLKALNDLGIETGFNKLSDLISVGVTPCLSEVKGSASKTDKYGHWQAGKKYTKRLDKRVYFLSQECYDITEPALKKLKVTLAYISGSRFRSTAKTTNRTALRLSDLVGEDIISTYEINL